jgi:ribosomal protein S12 methylthiotransferase accessory factor
MCEAIERYTGVWHGDEPVLRATSAEAGEAALLPDRLQSFSAAQLAGRAAWNADPANRLQLVTDPLPPDLPVDWGVAWSLTHERECLVPAAYAWYGHPDLNELFFCFADSNGCASGNNLEEAILQGFCEIVERDSVALWWYNRLRRPGVDLESIGDPYVDTLRGFYASMGRSLSMIDITADLGVPTFVGVSHRLDHPVQDIIVGFGAHPDPRIAAMRALTEVNQFLPAVERRDAEGNTRYLEDDVATLDWWRTATVATEPWVVPDPAQPVRSLADHPAPTSRDLADLVRDCVDRARAQGLEVIVLDQTRPDLDLSVVKVIVPGMRHFWRRLGPGRLNDVPVRLGWLPEPLREEQHNPPSVLF